ncbi:MAG TPA: acyl-CoA dehydrogenase family protein, partial [bacterium]|nr:acyl-CoA dehydrogenase family protein [bacterium]
LGIQTKQDAVHRLADLWAMGEAGAALGFSTARLFDQLDPLERERNAVLSSQGVKGSRAVLRAMAPAEKKALELVKLRATPAEDRDGARVKELENDLMVRFALMDSVANVLCPATKLWNTGHGANALREAVSLMGGYGITEDCPGFLGHKWMDAQLEATYEGPESVQRRQMSVTMVEPVFLAQFRQWTRDLRLSAEGRPDSGSCLLASAMELWHWTLEHLKRSTDADGEKLYHSNRQGVTFPMADALAWLLSSRAQILDVLELEAQGRANPAVVEGLPGTLSFLTDLCQMQAARAAGEVSRICAELVFGYQRHPEWNAADCADCFCTDDLGGLESAMPGMEGGALAYADTVGKDGSHAHKRGPCASTKGLEPFLRLQSKVSACMTGSRLAKDRAAASLTQVMIPEALDYPRA